jgi:hypothetical protein
VDTSYCHLISERPNNGQFTSPYQEWREQYQQGHTAPADALLEQYRHTICIAGAIRAQIDGKTYRQAAIDIGRNPRTFPKYMKRVRNGDKSQENAGIKSPPNIA